MSETIEPVFVKLGGSFITYKDKPFSINYRGLENIVEILYRVNGKVDLLLGNGGGGFAHYTVNKYSGSDTLRLITMCQDSTRMLNHIIVDYLARHGFNIVSIQTSAVIIRDKEGYSVFIKPIHRSLELGLIPVIYGECIFSSNGYEIISTEKVFEILSEYIQPHHIVLITNVDGIYSCDPVKCSEPVLIRYIDHGNLDEVLDMLMESSSRDATGSIYGKVSSMARLSEKIGVKIHIVSGYNIDDAVKAILGQEFSRGTTIDLA